MALETRLRAEEAYYDMTKVTDKLYAQSKNGNNFYKLYELIISENNILLACRNIKRNTGSNTKGSDGKTVKDYANISMEELISTVRNRLANFQPMSVRRVFIPKTNGKERPLGIPTFEDRLIQQCIKQILELICEAKFHAHNYGFKPLRSTKHAVSRMMTLAQVKQYLDNSISKISSQQLVCAVSKLFITDGEIHHIKPKENGGNNNYDNLLYIDKNVHKLIHLKDDNKIKIYLNHFEKRVFNYNEFIHVLNKYRELAGNKTINLSK